MPGCVPAMHFGEAVTVWVPSAQLSFIFVWSGSDGGKEATTSDTQYDICGFGAWILCYFRLIVRLKLLLCADLSLDVSLMTLSSISCFRNLRFAISVWKCSFAFVYAFMVLLLPSTEKFILQKLGSGPLLHANKGASLQSGYSEEQKLCRRRWNFEMKATDLSADLPSSW